MKRLFTRSQKAALYIAANGSCERCGKPLEQGWHADHIVPFSRGGNTVLSNGQALCPQCNLIKGKNIVKELKLRPFQRDFVNMAIEKVQTANRVIVGNIHPGSGKTFAVLLAANELFRMGKIDTLVVLVPRRNLAAQFEGDWFDLRKMLRAYMSDLHWRMNETPLIKPGGNESGYITTYQSLVEQSAMHARQLKGRRVFLVCDEASQLGSDNPPYIDTSTKSAEAVRKLALDIKPELIAVLSGTPTRTDDKPLLFAYPEFYDEYVDDYGVTRWNLNADVEADYLTGVRHGYLRPFEFILHDGYVDWVSIGADSERLKLSEETRVYRIIKEPGYWHKIVDKFADHLKEQRAQIHHGFCGLIAAYDQRQAKKIYNYMDKTYPELRCIVAVSEDGKEAHQNLSDFRAGGYDVLITVNMAYIGFDHKPINVILPLTGYRTEPYLRQLFARGMRMMPGVDPELQTCYGIVPDDTKMSDFVESLRTESQEGIALREKDAGRKPTGDSNRISQEELGYAANADLTSIRGKGINSTGDLDPTEFSFFMALKQRYNSAEPPTRIKAMFEDYANNYQRPPEPSPESRNIPFKPMKDREKDARVALEKLCRRAAMLFMGEDFAAPKTMLRRAGFKKVTACTLDEIQEQIVYMQNWLSSQGE